MNPTEIKICGKLKKGHDNSAQSRRIVGEVGDMWHYEDRGKQVGPFPEPTILDRIRSGEFMVGVCTGSDTLDTDLQSEVLTREPMVIIPSGLTPIIFPRRGELGVITIEDYSGAWRSFKDEVGRLRIRREVSLESFFSVAQMAIAGFGHGMVPVGVAKTLKVPESCLINLGDQGLYRPVRFVARKSTYSLPIVASFYQLLAAKLAA